LNQPAASLPRWGLARNGGFAILTVAVTALCLFAVYRFTNQALGLRALGTWSVTFGLMSLTGIADLGLPLAMVREVARLRIVRDWRGLQGLVAAAMGYTFVATLGAALIGVPAVQWAVDAIVFKGSSGVSRPFALACAFAASLTSVSSALTGALEGMERYDLKFYALLLGNLTLVGTAYVLVRGSGVEGIALSFVAQGIVVTIAGAAALWLSLRRRSEASRDPAAARLSSRLRTAVRIGLPLRVAGLASFVFEPVTRLLVGSFGGAASVGIYEAASRMCIQGHTLISSALQVVVPRLSALSASDPAQSRRMFASASKLTATGAILGFCALALAAASVSFLLFSRVNGVFVEFVLVLGAAWMLHVLAAPTYFANIADGSLAWNWLSQWIAVAVNIVIAPLSAWIFGWHGVIAGPLLGLVSATVAAVLARYRRTRDAVLGAPLKEALILLGVAVPLGALQVLSAIRFSQTTLVWVCSATFAAFCLAGALAAPYAVRQITTLTGGTLNSLRAGRSPA
jgi:O-antigen/teichoic acid export membrane protein